MSAYLEHTAGVNERWDTLAFTYYGDPTRYRPIVEANAALFLDLSPIPAMLPFGLVLRIPVLDPASSATGDELPPWER